jgi:hypothetical protein
MDVAHNCIEIESGRFSLYCLFFLIFLSNQVKSSPKMRRMQ